MRHGYSIKYLIATGGEHVTSSTRTFNGKAKTLELAKKYANSKAAKIEQTGATILDAISY